MSLSDAASLYTRSCDTCGEDLGNNCAHYASNALANAGFDITSAHSTINARCNAPKGSRRIIRAKELRAWIIAHGFKKHSNPPPYGTAAFFYCERNRDGQGHCGFIDDDGNDQDTGTGSDFGDVHEYYY